MYNFDLQAKLNPFKALHLEYPIEIRTVPTDKKPAYASIVPNADVAFGMATAFVKFLNEKPQNIYMTFNPLEASCMAMEHATDKVTLLPSTAQRTASDKMVSRRRFLLIDADVVRSASVSSTDEEKALALEVTKNIYNSLISEGYPDMYVADSGNGYHLLLPIDLPNNKESDEVAQKALKGLASRFSTEQVAIDTTVHNAARLTKVYGTLSVKGRSTIDRPHRKTRLLYAPETRVPATKEQLIALAGNTATTKPAQSPIGQSTFDLLGFLSRHSIQHREPEPYNGGTRIILDSCPFNSEHTGTEVAVFQLAGGALSFKCQHQSCSDKHWAEFRAHYEPERHQRITQQPGATRALPERAPKRTAPQSYNPWLIDYSSRNRIYTYAPGILCKVDGNRLIIAPLSDDTNPLVRKLREDVREFMLEDLSFTDKARSECIKALPEYAFSNHKGHGIAFSNGWIDMQTLVWHADKNGYTFPIVYDFPFVTEPQATPLFDKFLSGQKDLLENKDSVLYMIGDCISPCKSRVGGHRKAYLIQGQAGSGKSSMVDLIKRMLPEDATMDSGLGNMADPTLVVKAIGKTLVYSREGCGGKLQAEFTKRVIDGESIATHVFHVSKSTTELNATFLWADNDLPVIYGDKKSITKRLSAYRFDRVFRETSEEVQKIEQVIAEAELSKIVCNAILLWTDAQRRGVRVISSKHVIEDAIETEATSIHSFFYDVVGFSRKSLSASPAGDVVTIGLPGLYSEYVSHMKEDNGNRRPVQRKYFAQVVREELLPTFGYLENQRNARGSKLDGGVSCVTRETVYNSNGSETVWTVRQLINAGVDKHLIGRVLRGINTAISELFAFIVKLEDDADREHAKQEAFDSLTKEQDTIAKALMELTGATMDDITIE